MSHLPHRPVTTKAQPSSRARRHGTKEAPWTRRVWLFSAGARSGKAVWALLASSLNPT